MCNKMLIYQYIYSLVKCYRSLTQNLFPLTFRCRRAYAARIGMITFSIFDSVLNFACTLLLSIV